MGEDWEADARVATKIAVVSLYLVTARPNSRDSMETRRCTFPSGGGRAHAEMD